MHDQLNNIAEKKAELFAQQQALAEQLAALQSEERALEKEARREAVAQVEKLILENNIPRYEIHEIYQRNQIEGRGRKAGKPAKFEVANPQPEQLNRGKEIAAQLSRLSRSGEIEEFTRVLRANEDLLDSILASCDEDLENQIIEALV